MFPRPARPCLPLLTLAAIAPLLLLPTGARAQVVGYRLLLSGNFNTPTVRIENISTLPTANLTALTLTVGNTAYNFDWANDVAKTAGLGHSLMADLTGTTNPAGNTGAQTEGNNDGFVSNDLPFTFTGFAPGAFFQFVTDVDPDGNGAGTEDYRTRLFNNGAAPNAQVTATFSTGQVLRQTLPDTNPAPGPTSFAFPQTVSAAVPEPGAGALLVPGAATALLGSLALGRRRRRQTA